MDGVAYTFGSDDGSEKEVHFSLKHIVNSYKGDTDDKKNARVREEILGVLTHEIVHCYQYNGQGTAPGGLIEGIAGEYPVFVCSLVFHGMSRLCTLARQFFASSLETNCAERKTRTGAKWKVDMGLELGCWL